MILVAVQGEMALAAPAAAAWGGLVRDVASATGVSLLISSPAGAYRDEAMVVDMWRNPRKYGATKGTARPRSLGGPGSVHENGLCVDINNWERVGTKTLDNLAAKHGFRRTIAIEPWHYEHSGTMPAGGDTTRLPATSVPEGIIDMDTILLALGDGEARYGSKNKIYYALFTPSTGRVWDFQDPLLANQLVLKFGQMNRETGKPTGSAFNAIKYAEWENLHGGTFAPGE